MPSRSRARLARETGERLVVHDAFGTAVVGDVDLATARAERYAEPGALPEVLAGVAAGRTSSRRDFSINAMAVAAAPASTFGDAPRPARRLGRSRRRHRPRACTARSFRDDPTRILRARPLRGPAPVRARRGDRRAGARHRPRRPRHGRSAEPRLRDALLLAAGRGRGAGAALALLESLGVLHAIAPGLARRCRRASRSSTSWPLRRPTSTAAGPGSRCSSARCRRPGADACCSGCASAAATTASWPRRGGGDPRRARRPAADEAALVVGGDAGRQLAGRPTAMSARDRRRRLAARAGPGAGPGDRPHPARAAGREARRPAARPRGGAAPRAGPRSLSQRPGRTAGDEARTPGTGSAISGGRGGGPAGR